MRNDYQVDPFWSQPLALLLITLGATPGGLRATEATVLRDGRPQTIPADGVVPSDVVLLAAGSLIPADGVLLAAKDFFKPNWNMASAALAICSRW